MSPSYEFAYAMEEIGMAIIPGLLSGIPSGAFGIASYILTALALYTLAKRRAIDHAWLAWVPVLNCWLVGSLSDQYRYVVLGQNKSKRKILLILSILTAAFTVTILVLAVTMAVGAIMSYSHAEIMTNVMGPVMAILGMCLPLVGVGIAYAVIRYMALFDIYRSVDPSNAVLFLVLSIFFGITEPFFLFFNRNRDSGMPPRRQPEPAYIPEEQPQWQPQEPVQEAWDAESMDNREFL